jgi:hypothetical protein
MCLERVKACDVDAADAANYFIHGGSGQDSYNS